MRHQSRSNTARALADTIGHTAAARLIAAFGGRRIYIPVRIPIEHPLAVVIGRRACEPLAERWGGERLELPDDRTVLLDLRNRQIAEQYQAGEPIRSLARRYGLSSRMIRKVLDQLEVRNRATREERGMNQDLVGVKLPEDFPARGPVVVRVRHGVWRLLAEVFQTRQGIIALESGWQDSGGRYFAVRGAHLVPAIA